MKKEEKIKTITKIIADYYSVDEALITTRTRKAEIVKVRHLMLYMIRYELGLTFREISEILNKEVSTIIRNFQTVSSLVNHDKLLQKEITELKNSIRKEIEISA